MSKELRFHSDRALVTIVTNGVPVALHGEVDIVVRRPTKMSQPDKAAWSQCTSESAQYASCELVEAGTASD